MASYMEDLIFKSIHCSSALEVAHGIVWKACESGLFTAGKLPPDGIWTKALWLGPYIIFIFNITGILLLRILKSYF